jgi:hypothetical protein
MNAEGSTAQDSDIVRAIERASRFAETFCGRSFVATTKTLYAQRHPRACPSELLLPADLVSITSVTVDDDANGTYEITLVEDTDFWVERENDGDTDTPIVALVLNPDAATVQISSWPTRRRAVKITGLWGYSYELESSTLTTNGSLTAAATSITVSATAASLIYPGDTIVVESEQMEVTAVATVTLTVVRGINGTTAATHATAKTVYIRRYPRDVERAVSADAARYMWWASRGMMDQASVMREPWPAIRDSLQNYKRWAVA